MRTADEMVHAVHEQAEVLRQKQSQRRLTLAVGACGVLAVMLIAAIGAFSGLWHSPRSSAHAGASLAGGAGSYVLVAMAAFMLGVIITVVFMRQARGKPARDRNAGQAQGSFLKDEALLMAAGGKKAPEDEETEKMGKHHNTKGGTV